MRRFLYHWQLVGQCITSRMKKKNQLIQGDYFCFLLNSLLIFLLILAGCNHPLPEKEAKKYLQAFDNDLIQLSSKIGKTHACQAMWKLCSLKNVPLPYVFSSNDSTIEYSNQFVFDHEKGYYQYKASSGSFVKTASCDSVIIDFPYRSEHDTMARFVIVDYSEGITLFQSMYPLRINAFLKIGNRVMMSVHQEGSISHGFPVSGDFKIDFSQFSIQAHLKTKLFKDYGKLKLDLSVWSVSKKIIQWTTQSRITVTADNFFVYNSVDMEFEMFPVRVKVFVDHESMNPYSKRWMDDFNHHSAISIYDLNYNQFIGNVKLVERPQSDRLNFAVIYENTSYEFLDEFLLSVRKILNVKM